MEPPSSGSPSLGRDGGGGGALFAETAPRLANVIWWRTGVTDRSVNAAIWFELEQISAAFWGQNNPALPICGGTASGAERPPNTSGVRREKKTWWAAGNEELKLACVIGGWFPNSERGEGVALLLHQEQ